MSETPTGAAKVLYDKVDEVSARLEDGLQLSDLAYCLKAAIECSELMIDQTGPAKREIAIQFIKEVLRRTDGPGPDILIDPIIEAVVPPLIDLVVDATKGKLEVNGD